MSYKDQRESLGLGPAGSLANHTSTQDGSKWHHGVDGAGIAKLTKLSGQINEIVEATAKDVAKAQIKVGRLLNEARALIPGDLQFGQWREKNTQINNKSTANKLMNLATMVGDGRITQEMVDALPVSTLKELISAPDSVLIHIREKLADDEPVTRSTVRDAIKETREPLTIDHDDGQDGSKYEDDEMAPKEKQEPKKPVPPAMPTSAGPTARQQINKILELQLVERLQRCDTRKGETYKGIKPIEWAWLVFGLDPDPASLPSIDTIDMLKEAFDNRIELCCGENEHYVATIERAHNLIHGEY